MKNHRFLWLRNRTTNNRKCEKARNIKEKRTIEMFSTVSSSPSRQPVLQEMNFPEWEYTKTSDAIRFSGVFVCLCGFSWMRSCVLVQIRYKPNITEICFFIMGFTDPSNMR